MKSLKYVSTSVVCQEVPNEISLVFNISGCQRNCPGCHSQYLAEDTGANLLANMDFHINQYKDYITCVCLMGGDQNRKELIEALKKVKSSGLKTCLYTGCDSTRELQELFPLLDYLKVGHYDESLGGLTSPSTNQKMYKVYNLALEDITSTFWNK